MQTKGRMNMRKDYRVHGRSSVAGLGMLAVCLSLAPSQVQAALRTKAGTGTDLTAAGSWDSLPGSGDVAAWTNTSLCLGLTLPSNMSWSGILVAGALTDIDITGTGSLTLGTSGIDLSAATVNLSLGNAIALGGNQTWSVTNSRTLAVSGAVSGSYSLTKAGAGTLALTGTNSSWTSNTTVNAGTLNLNGGFGGTIGTGASSVFGVGWSNGVNGAGAGTVAIGAVANIGGGTFRVSQLLVGYTGGTGDSNAGSGWLTMTNGTITGTNATGYFVIGGENSKPGNGYLGVGQVDLSGNSVINFNNNSTNTSDTELGVRGGKGVFNISGNAAFNGNIMTLGTPNGSKAEDGNSRTYVNQNGGTVTLSSTNGLSFPNKQAGAIEVYNLNGGVLNTKIIKVGSGVGVTNAIFNFNGGTLKAGAASTTFMSGLSRTIIYSGGATIDDGGNAITISQALNAPTGYGLGAAGTILTPTAAGTGYVNPPNITFNTPSGGVPATGYAELNADGTIKDIVITCPGSGYTSGQALTVTLAGGGGGTNATFTGLTASTASSGGGLTKAGSNTLTLTGINTFTGSTTISGGTLALGSAGSLSNSPVISVANGATFDVSAVAGYALASGQTLKGMGNVTGAVTVARGATLAGGGVGTLTTANLTIANGSSYTWKYGGGTADRVDVNGLLTVATGTGVTINVSALTAGLPATTTLFTFNSISGAPADGMLGWTITGLSAYKAKIRGNSIMLMRTGNAIFVL